MKYRKEIDGLRALAVLPVIFFHAGFEAFSGGFFGVDIFFVISGYLITTIIVDAMERDSFSLLNFYERRARRILPALFFVMLCSLPFAWFWLPPNELRVFSQSLVAVTLFASNILFYLTSGYFDSASELKPLLHTWSLGVEEQYYILYPLFLMLVWKLGRNWIFCLLLTLAIVSLIYAQLLQSLTLQHQTFAFYLLPARGFEILIGVLISLYMGHNPRINLSSKLVSQLASSFGLVLILYAIFAFDKSTLTPSFYSLVPTIGAGLILVFSNNQTLVGKLLGGRIFVSIGLISYSTYLWHLPLIVFARFQSLDDLTNTFLLVLCLSSLILGYLSWKYVENPFRNSKIISFKKFIVSSFLLALIFITLGLAGHLGNGFSERSVVPNYISELSTHSYSRKKCDTKFKDKLDKHLNIDFCNFGDNSKNNVTIAIFGDSHSSAILPVMDKIGKNRSEKYSHIGIHGCPPLLDVGVRMGNTIPGVCENLANKQYNFVKDNKVKNVFLVAKWSLYTDGEYGNLAESGMYHLVPKRNASTENIIVTKNKTREYFQISLENTIKKYQELGANVFVLAQVPQQKVAAHLIYEKLYRLNITNKLDSIIKKSVSKDDHLELQAFNRGVISKLQKQLGFVYINPDKAFCDDEKCYIGNAKTSSYYDRNHLSAAGSILLYELLIKSINKFSQ
jgi:peptidoglycan/LPS O-acetylase OafA/YrhL